MIYFYSILIIVALKFLTDHFKMLFVLVDVGIKWFPSPTLVALLVLSMMKGFYLYLDILYDSEQSSAQL